jgi:hypothetical protein
LYGSATGAVRPGYLRVRERKKRAVGAAHFEVCSTKDNIRYDSCFLNSYFLDKSFQMHFVGKLGFELKNNVKEKI